MMTRSFIYITNTTQSEKQTKTNCAVRKVVENLKFARHVNRGSCNFLIISSLLLKLCETKKMSPDKKIKKNAEKNAKKIEKIKQKLAKLYVHNDKKPVQKKKKKKQETLIEPAIDVSYFIPSQDVEHKNNCLKNKNNLLLAYTYFMCKDDCARYISVGFSTNTLQPVVILCNDNNNFVELSVEQWHKLFTYREEIDRHVNNDFQTHARYPLSSNEPTGKTLEFWKNQPHFSIYNGDQYICIGKTEWEFIQPLTNLLNSILDFYARVQNDILQYYIKYTQLCFEKNAMCLGQDLYFPPVQKSDFNSVRLFNEIGLFLFQKYKSVDLSENEARLSLGIKMNHIEN